MTIKITITAETPGVGQIAMAQVEEYHVNWDAWHPAKVGPVALGATPTELWIHSGQRIKIYETK